MCLSELSRLSLEEVDSVSEVGALPLPTWTGGNNTTSTTVTGQASRIGGVPSGMHNGVGFCDSVVTSPPPPLSSVLLAQSGFELNGLNNANAISVSSGCSATSAGVVSGSLGGVGSSSQYSSLPPLYLPASSSPISGTGIGVVLPSGGSNLVGVSSGGLVQPASHLALHKHQHQQFYHHHQQQLQPAPLSQLQHLHSHGQLVGPGPGLVLRMNGGRSETGFSTSSTSSSSSPRAASSTGKPGSSEGCLPIASLSTTTAAQLGHHQQLQHLTLNSNPAVSTAGINPGQVGFEIRSHKLNGFQNLIAAETKSGATLPSIVPQRGVGSPASQSNSSGSSSSSSTASSSSSANAAAVFNESSAIGDVDLEHCNGFATFHPQPQQTQHQAIGHFVISQTQPLQRSQPPPPPPPRISTANQPPGQSKPPQLLLPT
ncbi:unnamed protein product [Protopolystoma xenopodis]|uniref:Uncharacterized protein n=1 Tax=Protopolystoma xenopodis TaxID=117903 RepID=A0A3S5CIR8_9PLAT|nr:unnamed protein product [Protopolystoma xenopodis]